MIKLCGILLRSQRTHLNTLKVKQNNSCPKVSIQSVEGVSTKRCASTSLAGPGASAAKDEKITPFGWLLMLVPITTFGLGCWQIKRKAWKEQLIKDLGTSTKMPPVELPEDLSDIKDMEYRTVKVRGTFLHDKELLMGPRSYIRPDDVKTIGGLISQRDSGNGYWVVTPFQLAGRDDIILINRGWISQKNVEPASRLAGQITDEVEMTCVVRRGEQKPRFTPESKGGLFLYRDLDRMCALTGAKPVFLDASYESSVPGGPIGGQTRITLHNDHLSYTVTWYCLSLATGILWYRTIVKGKPPF